MLKVRLIACILTKNDLVVQSFGFNRYLPIGNVKTAIEFYVNWDVDEIVIIDIDATRQSRAPNVDLVNWASSECFVPLTVGGGINCIKDINDLLQAGADKVCINRALERTPQFVEQAAKTFGSQCITVSLDAKKDDFGFQLYDYSSGQLVAGKDITAAAKQAESLGAGEILLNSVDHDGSRKGYDLELLSTVSSAVSIPVIALGGVGRLEHLADGVTQGGCQAVAAANIFQHIEHSTIAAKAQMKRAGLPVRLSSNVKYENFDFDLHGRPI